MISTLHPHPIQHLALPNRLLKSSHLVCCCFAVTSVTSLDKISQFGRWFLVLGDFVSEKYRPNHLGAIFFKKIAQNSP
jgi:hypothetical protein